MNIKLAFILPFIALVVGCATTSDVSGPTGMAIGSVTFDSTSGAYGYVIANSQGKVVATPSAGSSVPFSKADDAELGMRGGTFAVALPEGTYRIVGWQVRRLQTTYSNAKPFQIEFQVQQGKATYLGNLHFDQHWENVSLRDRAARDIPLIQKREAAVAAMAVSMTIREGTNIEKLGDGYVGRSQMLIYMPR